MLSFQKLDVYQRAIQFLVVALEVISRLPNGHADLAGQLRDSAQSTVANIAEGTGRRTRDGIRGASRRDDGDGHHRCGAISARDRVARGVVAMLTKICDL